MLPQNEARDRSDFRRRQHQPADPLDEGLDRGSGVGGRIIRTGGKVDPGSELRRDMLGARNIELGLAAKVIGNARDIDPREPGYFAGGRAVRTAPAEKLRWQPG